MDRHSRPGSPPSRRPRPAAARWRLALLPALALLTACSLIPPGPDLPARPVEAPAVRSVPSEPAPGGLAAQPTLPGADVPGASGLESATEPIDLGGPAAVVEGCDPPPTFPPGTPTTPENRTRMWREPLPRAALWNPPGPKRVGLQAGHWLVEQAPAELRGLQHGAVGGGRMEWEVNLDIARRTQRLLEAAGVEVDLLPATVPVRYKAHAFISIHADGDTAGRLSGFKIARPAFSSVPEADDRLVDALNATYAAATSLARDDEHITPRMRYYYAFNSRRYCHAVAPGVPQAIVEAGFLTSAADRVLLLGNPEAAARGIANGILRFLNESLSGAR